MTMAWFADGSPPRKNVHRGGAPVGMISELPVLEKGAILLLRQWCDGEAGQIEIANDLATAFGPARARIEMECLGDLMNIVISGGKRPLIRHGTECQCFGGDESAFANLVASAVVGEREDAIVFALALLAPVHAYAAVHAAERFGLAILGLARVFSAEVEMPHPNATRH